MEAVALPAALLPVSPFPSIAGPAQIIFGDLGGNRQARVTEIPSGDALLNTGINRKGEMPQPACSGPGMFSIIILYF